MMLGCSACLPNDAVRAATRTHAALTAQADAAAGAGAADTGVPTRRSLVWAPYTIIPDAAGDGLSAMLAHVEAVYEAAYPEVDLQLWQPVWADLYNVTALSEALATGAAHVLELDGILLPSLLAAGVIQPGTLTPDVPYHPEALAAVTRDDVVWGVPHYMCTHVVYALTEAVTRATNLTALLDIIATAGADTAVGLAADFASEYGLPQKVVAACASNYAAANTSGYSQCYDGDGGGLGLQSPTITDVASVLQLCTNVSACLPPKLTGTPGAAPQPCASQCLVGGRYVDEDAAATDFGNGVAGAFIGYTESLNTIRELLPATTPTFVASAALGSAVHPIAFTDSYMIGVGCTADSGCLADARNLISTVLDTLPMLEYVLMSHDAVGRVGAAAAPVPRYLLPARLDVWSIPSVAADPYYPALEGVVPVNGTSIFPELAFVDDLATFRAALQQALGPAEGGAL
jgi:thiamine pyridinylase